MINQNLTGQIGDWLVASLLYSFLTENRGETGMIQAKDAIELARSLLGTPYDELDCINLIKKVIRTAPGGLKNYTDAGTDELWSSYQSSGKYKHLIWRQDGIQNAKPGMLAFKGRASDARGDGQPHHVGIVAVKSGQLTVIHASSANRQVVETPLEGPYGWTLLAVHRYIEIGEEGEALNDNEKGSAVVNTPNGGKLNLRANPGKNCKVLATIPNGETLEIIAEETTGWLKARWNGYAGYVSADMVEIKGSSAGDAGSLVWYVHVPCQNQVQAEALADLIPGAIAAAAGGND